MIGDLDIILAQLNPTVGNIAGNINKIRTVRDAHIDADLIIFSEIYLIMNTS